MKKVIIMAVALFLAVLSAGCNPLVGTWNADIEKTLESIESVPKRQEERFEGLEDYKKWLRNELKGLELTFTNRSFEVRGNSSGEVVLVIYEMTCTRKGGTFDMYWKDDGKYSLVIYDVGSFSSGPWLLPEGEFAVDGNKAVWRSMKLLPPGDPPIPFLEIDVQFNKE